MTNTYDIIFEKVILNHKIKFNIFINDHRFEWNDVRDHLSRAFRLNIVI